MSADVLVSGGATAEELAVVLALIAQVERGAPRDGYAEWRRTRLAALRTRMAR